MLSAAISTENRDWNTFNRATQDFHRFASLNWARGVAANGEGPEIDNRFLPFSKLRKYFADGDRLKGLLETIHEPELAAQLSNYDISTELTLVVAVCFHIDSRRQLLKFLQNRCFSAATFPYDLDWFKELTLNVLNEDEAFAERFFAAQFHFWNPSFKGSYTETVYPPDYILPIISKEQIDEKEGQRTYKVELEPEYNKLGLSQSDNRASSNSPTNVYVLKSFAVDEVQTPRVKDLRAAYLQLREKLQSDSALTHFYASFEHGYSFNILLENAGEISLEKYFQEENPPLNAVDKRDFWSSLLHLIVALKTIHREISKETSTSPILTSWNQDIKPENILVCKQPDESPYKSIFKLADLGLDHFAEFAIKSPSTPDGSGVYGERVYGAPERFHVASLSTSPESSNDLSSDVWSLGCVFSEALTWASFGLSGELGLQNYRFQRYVETEGAGYRGGFHNARSLLECVKVQHSRLLQEFGEQDPLSSSVLQMTQAMLFHKTFRKSLEELEADVKQILSDYPNHSADEDTAPTTADVPVVDRVERLPQHAADNAPLVSSSSTKEWSFVHPPARPSMQRSSTALPSLTIDETLQWRSDLDRGNKTSTSTFNETVLRELEGRDHIFLIDNSSSMRKHWDQVTVHFEALAYTAKHYDPDGIQLNFTIGHRQTRDTRVSKLVALLRSLRPEADEQKVTNIDYELGRILEEFSNKGNLSRLSRAFKRKRPANIYVFTDGLWAPNYRLEAIIKEQVMNLRRKRRAHDFVGIQFIQFGSDPDGRNRLMRLDRLAVDQGLDQDIVDTVAADGNVYKMLLGATNKAWDHFDDEMDDLLSPLPPPLSALKSRSSRRSAMSRESFVSLGSVNTSKMSRQEIDEYLERFREAQNQRTEQFLAGGATTTNDDKSSTSGITFESQHALLQKVFVSSLLARTSKGKQRKAQKDMFGSRETFATDPYESDDGPPASQYRISNESISNQILAIEELMVALQPHDLDATLELLINFASTFVKVYRNFERATTLKSSSKFITTISLSTSREGVVQLQSMSISELNPLLICIQNVLTDSLAKLGEPRTLPVLNVLQDAIKIRQLSLMVLDRLGQEDFVRDLFERGFQSAADEALSEHEVTKFWAMSLEVGIYLLHVVDVAILAHAGSHVNNFLDKSLTGSITIPDVPPFMSESSLVMTRENLACLSGFLGFQPVWVLHSDRAAVGKDPYVLCHLSDFSLVWGRVLGVPSADDEPDCYQAFRTIGGYLVPWMESDDINSPAARGTERLCHWVTESAYFTHQENKDLDTSQQQGTVASVSSDEEDWTRLDTNNKPLRGDEEILIGALPCMEWEPCHHSLRDTVEKFNQEQGLLTAFRSRPGLRYLTLKQLNFGFSGYGGQAGAVLETQYDLGKTLKQTLLESWADPNGRDPWIFEKVFGVLISTCTFNAKRTSLRGLLQTRSMQYVINQCHLPSQGCREAFRTAIYAVERDALVRLLMNHPDWSEEIKKALFTCLTFLSETGLRRIRNDQQHSGDFVAFWKPYEDDMAYQVTLKSSKHAWVRFLKEGQKYTAMGVMTEASLRTSEDNRHTSHVRRHRSQTNRRTLLETAICINRNRVPKGVERHYCQVGAQHPSWSIPNSGWEYMWNVRYVGNEQIWMPQGQLVFERSLGDWYILTAYYDQPGFFGMGLGRRDDPHLEYGEVLHSRYRPVPVHVR